MKNAPLFAAALLSLASLLPALHARGQEPQASSELPKEAILRIETGTHTTRISRIGADASGKWLATGSLDKTVRVWEAATGKLARTLRPPMGQGNEGMIYSVALSPDGATIAAAGWTGYEWDMSYCIYLFDRESGVLTRRIAGLPQVINDLAFSRDGSRIAAGLGRDGIRVFSSASGETLFEDHNYGGECYALDFDGNGRLVTVCRDSSLRLYSSKGALRTKVKAPDGAMPSCIRFSPDGSRIAVGYDDVPRVSVVSGANLSRMTEPSVDGIESGRISAVTWSPDGRALYGGATTDRSVSLRRWSEGGEGAFADLPVADDAIFDLRTLPDGTVAVASSEPRLTLVSGDGTEVLRSTEVATADYRGFREGFKLSPSGGEVAFGYKAGGGEPARFSIAPMSLTMGQAPIGFGTAPLLKASDLTVTGWQDTLSPRLNGRLLGLQPHELSRCLAIAPDNQSFLLGTQWYLRYFKASGEEAWSVPSPSPCWSVNVNQSDGSLGVAAFRDGTIRWYRMRDGKELLAFFPHADKKRWVAWTRSGYYACSPGGEDLLGWHVNRGKDQAAGFFPASRFRERFYRPDVIAGVLSALDEAKALERADAAKKPGDGAKSVKGKTQAKKPPLSVKKRGQKDR